MWAKILVLVAHSHPHQIWATVGYPSHSSSQARCSSASTLTFSVTDMMIKGLMPSVLLIQSGKNSLLSEQIEFRNVSEGST